MAAYAIAVVAPDWTHDKPLAFTEAGYNRWKDSIEAGTRVLIFKTAPINALVAEAEVPDARLLKLTEWPMANVGEFLRTAEGEIATYVLPLRVLYNRDASIKIPLEAVRSATNDPQFQHQEWYPLDLDSYTALTNWP